MGRNPLEYSGTLRVDGHVLPLPWDLRGTRSMNAATTRRNGEAKQYIGVQLDGTRFSTDHPALKEMMRRLADPHDEPVALIARQTWELLTGWVFLSGKDIGAAGEGVVHRPVGLEQNEYSVMIADVDPAIIPVLEQALRSPIPTEKAGIRRGILSALQSAVQCARSTPAPDQ